VPAAAAAGWEGVWVDTFGHRYLKEFWPTPTSVALPPDKAALLARIGGARESRPWDVFCWKDGMVLFAEAKRHCHDWIRPSQTAFLFAAQAAGLPLSSFLIVEWSAS
jgi:hypothetical protein